MTASQIAPYVIPGFFGLVILILALVYGNHFRLTKKGVLPDQRRRELQAELLDAVKQASFNRGIEVELSGFWRGSGVKASQRNQVIDPLIQAHLVYLPPAPPNRNPILEMASDMWDFALCRPPRRLILSDRTWETMVHGATGMSIVIRKVKEMNWQSQNTGGGAIINSPQAGRDADVRSKNVTDSGGATGVSGDELTALVAALRADAKNMEDEAGRADIRELANKMEDESTSPVPDEDRISGMVSRATRYVSTFGGAMAATSEVLDAWSRLRGGA